MFYFGNIGVGSIARSNLSENNVKTEWKIQRERKKDRICCLLIGGLTDGC